MANPPARPSQTVPLGWRRAPSVILHQIHLPAELHGDVVHAHAMVVFPERHVAIATRSETRQLKTRRFFTEVHLSMPSHFLARPPLERHALKHKNPIHHGSGSPVAPHGAGGQVRTVSQRLPSLSRTLPPIRAMHLHTVKVKRPPVNSPKGELTFYFSGAPRRRTSARSPVRRASRTRLLKGVVPRCSIRCLRQRGVRPRSGSAGARAGRA